MNSDNETRSGGGVVTGSEAEGLSAERDDYTSGETVNNANAIGTPANTWSSTASAAESDVDGARDASRDGDPDDVSGVRAGDAPGDGQ